MSDKQELRPVCFIVMPFQKKKVTGQTGKGAPKNIDCDALWDKAYRPAIEESGYISCGLWRVWDGPCAVGDPMHVETSFVRNLGDLVRVRRGTPGRFMKGKTER